MNLTLKKIVYGSGESVPVVANTVIGLYFLYFLTDIVGMSPALAGTIFMIGRSWDAITDPAIGLFSDRTRTRWGRRRPYFFVAAIPLLVTFLCLWQQLELSTGLTFIYYTLLYMLFMTILTVFHVPYVSLITEFSTDYMERTSINNYRIFFQLFFGLIAAVIPKMIADSTSYSVMALILGIFMMSVALFLFANTKEPPLPQQQPKVNLFVELKSVFQNRAMQYLLVIYIGCYAAANVIESFVIYYMKYYLNREFDMSILFVIVIGAGIFSLPVWSKITEKIGKKQALFYGLVIWAVGQLGWILIAPNSHVFLVYVVGAIVGLGYGVAHVLPWAMLPDVVDIDELQIGKKREGVYSGIMTFFMKLANSLAIFLIGLVLEFSGYIANEVQSVETMQTIKWTMVLAPGIFVVIALIATFIYPYSREDHEAIRRQLSEK
ncbi:glycoside-pentoside-hexuronide (GPH):cation symporter [Solibacillus sp. CAU 1738]|uniref:MFS transporter n=1 Tax=Solibacillus sp. CAU 1738 TaxID=3140363 RepID=UPI00326127D4